MAERAPELRSGRLLLRHWRHDDRVPFAALNANSVVAEMLGRPLSPADSDELADRLEARLNHFAFGGWAVEELGSGRFIGMVGLDEVGPEFSFGPAIEVGWRLDPTSWGQGFATEAAAVALGYGFDHCGLTEVVAFTAAINVRSQAVMERLHMTRDRSGDFTHPNVADHSPLASHVLYRTRSVVAPSYEVVVTNP